MRRSTSLRLALLLVLLPACGSAHLKSPTSGLKTPLPGGDQRQVIISAPFADARTIRNRCGVLKNSNGDESGRVVCEGDPAQWVRALLARELTASGFTVLRTDDTMRDGAVKIDGALLKIFVEPIAGGWHNTVETDLSVKLVATSKTGLRAERTFFAKGRSASHISDLLSLNRSLENAFERLLRDMVGAILELMKQHPELGFEYRQTTPLAG